MDIRIEKKIMIQKQVETATHSRVMLDNRTMQFTFPPYTKKRKKESEILHIILYANTSSKFADHSTCVWMHKIIYPVIASSSELIQRSCNDEGIRAIALSIQNLMFMVNNKIAYGS